MKTAEEKWENWALKMATVVWDRERSSDEPKPKKQWEAGFRGGFCFGAEESREAYKYALRKAIGARKAWLTARLKEVTIKTSEMIDCLNRLRELELLEYLMEKVTP